MTTISRPVDDTAPQQQASRRRARRPEAAEARAARLRLRRRLLLWSLPGVLLLALVAGRLLTTVALGDQARQAYSEGNITGTQDAAEQLGRLNVIEPHKAYFALGDARVLAGEFDGARAAFEEALGLAPNAGDEACKVRVNLVLSLEKLSEAATNRGQGAQARTYDDRVLAVVADSPSGCFEGGADGDAGQQLRDAQQRVRDRQQAQSDAQQQNQQPGLPQPQPSQPSQEKQQQLDDKTKDNLQQRQQGDGPPNSSGEPPVDKPW